MKIAIIGDSFATDDVAGSWIDLIQARYPVTNFSQRGISQYRLLTIIEQHLPQILEHDCAIVWHTNPDRVYVNDVVTFPTRTLASHPHADLVAADSLSSSDASWRRTAETYYRVFHNEAQQQLYHKLVVQHIQQLLHNIQVLHCSGFELGSSAHSFADLARQYPGNINHFDVQGNQKVFEKITKQLNRKNHEISNYYLHQTSQRTNGRKRRSSH